MSARFGLSIRSPLSRGWKAPEFGMGGFSFGVSINLASSTKEKIEWYYLRIEVTICRDK